MLIGIYSVRAGLKASFLVQARSVHLYYLLELQAPINHKSTGSRFAVKPFGVTLHFRIELPRGQHIRALRLRPQFERGIEVFRLDESTLVFSP